MGQAKLDSVLYKVIICAIVHMPQNLTDFQFPFTKNIVGVIFSQSYQQDEGSVSIPILCTKLAWSVNYIVLLANKVILF